MLSPGAAGGSAALLLSPCGAAGGANTRALSYAALRARVSAAAAALAASHSSVASPSPSGVCVALSAAEDGACGAPQLVCLLACWALGAHAAALDLARWPLARVARVLRVSNACVLLVSSGVAARGAAERALELAGGAASGCVLLDASEVAEAYQSVDGDVAGVDGLAGGRGMLGSGPGCTSMALPQMSELGALQRDGVPGDVLAYVQFTSGSTGEPKGVLCERRHVLAYAEARRSAEDIGPGSVVLLASALTFDPYQGDVVAALGQGGGAALAVPPRAALLADPLATAAACGATHMCATPAVVGGADLGEAPASLRVLSLGGERMSHALLARWWAAPVSARAELRNVYGVTECCVYQTAAVMTPGCDPRCIGQRLACCDVDMRCSSGKLERAPFASASGESLELCISGLVLARGYLSDDALTAQRFVTGDTDGVRRYRTGDMCCALSAGSDVPLALVLVGRLDEQVKVAGARVELGEVDCALRACSLVEADLATSCVLDLGDGSPLRLVGVVVPASRDTEWDELSERATRACASMLVAPHCVPSRVVPIDEMPLSASGKVDRKAAAVAARSALCEGGSAIEACSGGSNESGFARPCEALVRAVWRSLGLSPQTPADSFGALGGDSLLAARAALELRRRMFGLRTSLNPDASEEERAFGVVRGAFSPAHVLQKRSLAEYAAFIAEHGATGEDGHDGVEAPAVIGDFAVVPVENQPSAPPSEAERLLCEAASSGRTDVVDSLLRAGVRADGGWRRPLPSKKRKGGTPAVVVLSALHYAAAVGAEACVRLLVEAGATLHAASASGALPAHLAAGCASTGATGSLRALLEAGTAPRCRDANEQNLAHWAARAGNVATLRIALSEARLPAESYDRWSRSPLHWAVVNGHHDAARALLEAGACAGGRQATRRGRAGKSTHLAQESPLELAARLDDGHSEARAELRRLLEEAVHVVPLELTSKIEVDRTLCYW